MKSSHQSSLPTIKVIGIGGGGSNAVSRMAGKIRGIEFIAANTDLQDLSEAVARVKIPIGKSVTRGMGAGMNPEVGRQAAEESRDDILRSLNGADLVFITCGLGGGTGSGAAPIVAECSREVGALSVAVVTKPFVFEGAQRRRIADESWIALSSKVDAIITVPNDRVFNIISRTTSLLTAFERIDDILRQAVQGMSDLISRPGLINVDFADIRAVMEQSGPAILGIGSATGESRAVGAAIAATQSPLLDLAIDGAKGVIFNISGRASMGMSEVNEVAKIITESVDTEARIIFGATLDPRLKSSELKVTVIAAGFGSEARQLPLNVEPRRDVSPARDSSLAAKGLTESHSLTRGASKAITENILRKKTDQLKGTHFDEGAVREAAHGKSFKKSEDADKSNEGSRLDLRQNKDRLTEDIAPIQRTRAMQDLLDQKLADDSEFDTPAFFRKKKK